MFFLTGVCEISRLKVNSHIVAVADIFIFNWLCILKHITVLTNYYELLSEPKKGACVYLQEESRSLIRLRFKVALCLLKAYQYSMCILYVYLTGSLQNLCSFYFKTRFLYCRVFGLLLLFVCSNIAVVYIPRSHYFICHTSSNLLAIVISANSRTHAHAELGACLVDAAL